jgi:hypothetical protein
MQTNTWTDFVNRVACSLGEGPLSVIHAETAEVADEPEDEAHLVSPTFVARGD